MGRRRRRSAASAKRPVTQVIREIKRFREGITLGGKSLRELIEEGRRGIGAEKMARSRAPGRSPIPPVAPTGFPPVTRPLLRKVAKKIGELPGVEKVILFGSYSRGNPTPDSDVDLFVVWNTHRPRSERWRAVSDLFAERPFPMDIVVRTPSQVRSSLRNQNCFLREIFSSGKVLFEKKP